MLWDTVPDRGAYPFAIPAIAKLERLELHPEVTFFVGENGSGKSTLLEAIAIKAGFNPEGGTKNFTGAFRPSESELHAHLRLARGATREERGFFLRAETMFNVATQAESYWASRSLHEMSHGESFLWVAMNRFGRRGLYLLDEPESALSPTRQLSFLARMRQLVHAGSQFVISTHSPILLAYPGARIVQLGADGIDLVRYEETEHYAVTRHFLQDPAASLERLFRDIEEED
ncbi:AAA family ATPase [Sandaracinus amylolyticus]|uniref:AAA family ATPase n=1 Tax=Sandaracinus amylolyticus TaxID=927083 RepID=UPI003AF34826